MTISVTTWAAAGVGLVLVTLLGAQTVRLSNEKAGRAADALMYANERTKAAQAHSVAIAEQADEFTRRIGEKDATIKAAHDLAAARATALADMRRAGNGVRDERAAAVARASQAGRNPDARAGGEATAVAIRMYDELFGEADGFAGILAGALEASRDAGATCQRQYDSLITAP